MGRWNLPQDMTGDDILPMNAKPNWVMPHDVEEEEAKKPTPAQVTLNEETPGSKMLIGAGQTFDNLLQGVKQKAGLLRNILPGNPSKWPQEVAQHKRENAEAEAALNKDPSAGYGRLGANVALGVTGPSRTILGAMATGAGLEGIPAQSSPSLADTLSDTAKGAILGGAGQAALNGPLTALAKAKNATQGRFANPEYANRYRIFKQNDVPGSLGDITQDPTIMAIENISQYIPASGRKPFLERQAQRLGEVVENAPEKIVGATPAQSKEDIGSVLSQSIKNKYAEVKNTARGMYDAVESRVQAVGNPPITPSNMSSEINTLLAKYPSAFAKLSDDPDTVKTLQTIASGMEPGKSPILGSNGQPISTPPNLTFSELRQLDSDLGSMIRQGRQLTARGDMNNKSFDQLVKVQKALRKDIEEWSQTVGDPKISKGVLEANKYFREKVTPFRKNQLTRKVIQDENFNPDNLAQSMFKLDSPHLSTQASEFLTPDGIQAGRFHLLNQAKKKAMDDTLTSGYSPSRFLKGTELGESGPKLFSDTELGQLGDLQELIGSSRRAASHGADPATGNRLAMLSKPMRFMLSNPNLYTGSHPLDMLSPFVSMKIPALARAFSTLLTGSHPLAMLSPFVSMKIPALARAFSTLLQSDKPMRFMLSNPNLYTGSHPLGRVAEEALRKSGAGAGTDFRDIR